MRVIIVNQFFYPDHSATSQLMTDLAEDLVRRGITVTVLAGRGRYNGGELLAPCEAHKGVKIIRAWTTSFGKRSFAGRLIDYLSFTVGALWRLLLLPRHDIILVLTTPPMINLIAVLVGRLRGMRVVALVQDLYPDVFVALGYLKSAGLPARVLEGLSRAALRGADRIIVPGECMLERVTKKIGSRFASRVEVIHNWADGSEVVPLASTDNPFIRRHNLEKKFVVLFSGNFGKVNDFSTVLEAARLLRGRSDILFLFIGDGVKSAEISEFVAKNRLGHIRMLPYQPRELLRYSLAAGNIHIVTLAAGLAGLSVPSKTYGGLAAGRPILFVGDPSSVVARIVEEYACGAVVASGESEKLAAIIVEFAGDKAKAGELGKRARCAFEERFDRKNAVSAYLDVFTKCLGTESRRLKSFRQHTAELK